MANGCSPPYTTPCHCRRHRLHQPSSGVRSRQLWQSRKEVALAIPNQSCSFALRNSRISASFSAPPQSANLTAGFTKLETELYEAIKQKDMPRLEQLLAPDYVLVTSARAVDPMDRKSWLDLIAVYNVESFTVGDVVVRCLVPRGGAGEACDLAVVSLVITQKAIVGGEDRSTDGGFVVDIWARHSGSWQLFSRYASTKSNRLPKVMQPRQSQK